MTDVMHERAMTRRTVLRLAALGSLGGLLAACTAAPTAAPPAAPKPTTAPAPAPAATAAPAPTAAAKPAATAAAPAATTAPAAAKPADTMKVILGIPPSLTHLPYMLGLEKGIYAQEGVELELPVSQANVSIAAALNGDMDMTGFGGSALRAAASGSPIKLVMTAVGKPLSFLYAKQGITKLEDLRGKTLAVTSVAGSPAVQMRRVLSSVGIDPEKDIQVLATQTSDRQWAAMLGGNVDAAFLTMPYAAQAKEAGFVFLADTADFVQGTQAQIGVSNTLLAAEPEKVRRFIRGSLKSIAYAKDKKDESVAFINQKFNLDPKVAQTAYDIVSPAFLRNGKATPEALVGEIGGDATVQDLAKYVDWTILDQVATELGLPTTPAA